MDAETGAGQHGVATATACALLDLECTVYMGAEDIRRQAPNVLRMKALGATVSEVTSGTGTLKDATNEAMRAWVTDVVTSHYVLGSAVGPHPFPSLVRDLQRTIGDEAAEQVRAVEGRLPGVPLGPADVRPGDERLLPGPGEDDDVTARGGAPGPPTSATTQAPKPPRSSMKPQRCVTFPNAACGSVWARCSSTPSSARR